MINIKPLKQSFYWDCGPACASMILDYYKVKPRYADITKAIKATKDDGTSPDNMVKGLKKFKIKAEYDYFCKISTIEEQLAINNPVLIAWFNPKTFGSHWSIATKITDSKITMIDPAYGKLIKLPIEQFSRLWFTIDPEAEKQYVLKHILSVVRWREMISVGPQDSNTPSTLP
jgi:ABC-type bacteriocin/lantibiotic exporter with double-glycine peptidase domain